MTDRVWIVTEADEFQAIVEIVRVIGVFDDEDRAHTVRDARAANEPQLEFRVQGWPINDTIA